MFNRLFLTLIATTVCISANLPRQAAAAEIDSRPEVKTLGQAYRILQARELLGKYYKKSIVKSGERVTDINGFVKKTTASSLGEKWQKKKTAIAKTIIREARRNGFDPIFVMAVIQTESSFNPLAKGSSGEIGLMQLMPATGEWIAHKIGVPWKGEKSLRDPLTNIKLGTAYLTFLRERFDAHGRLYVAAYNMGERNVNQALDNEVWPKDYPVRVMKQYLKFYSSLSDHAKAKLVKAVKAKKAKKTPAEIQIAPEPEPESQIGNESPRLEPGTNSEEAKASSEAAAS